MACCLFGSLKSAEAEAALFYEKLKGAEKALKKCMQEEAAGRQQAAADQEIISFLDLKVIIFYFNATIPFISLFGRCKSWRGRSRKLNWLAITSKRRWCLISICLPVVGSARIFVFIGAAGGRPGGERAQAVGAAGGGEAAGGPAGRNRQ